MLTTLLAISILATPQVDSPTSQPSSQPAGQPAGQPASSSKSGISGPAVNLRHVPQRGRVVLYDITTTSEMTMGLAGGAAQSKETVVKLRCRVEILDMDKEGFTVGVRDRLSTATSGRQSHWVANVDIRPNLFALLRIATIWRSCARGSSAYDGPRSSTNFALVAWNCPLKSLEVGERGGTLVRSRD